MSDTPERLLQTSAGHVELTFDFSKLAGDLVVFVRLCCEVTQALQQIFERE